MSCFLCSNIEQQMLFIVLQWFALSASPAYWTGAGILDVFGVDYAVGPHQHVTIQGGFWYVGIAIGCGATIVGGFITITGCIRTAFLASISIAVNSCGVFGIQGPWPLQSRGEFRQHSTPSTIASS